MSNSLKYVSFSSCVDPSFWHKLAQLKLDVDRLNEPVHDLWGNYSNVESRGPSNILTVNCSSFNRSPENSEISVFGNILNKNTIEGFKDLDKEKYLQDQGTQLLNLIKNGNALEDPRLLTKFTIICFADLKKYKFIYWFAFPAINVIKSQVLQQPKFAENEFTPRQLEDLNNADRSRSAIILEITEDGLQIYELKTGFEKITKENDSSKFWLCFADSSNDSQHPGWPLRNLLALYAFYCPKQLEKPVNVLCLRYRVEKGAWSAGKSLVLRLHLSLADGGWDLPQIVGWETNEKGKYGPRSADLRSAMDPMVLMEASVDLNLKLMKWNVVPDLNLDVVRNCKCLLLGAGTLGCSVARSLLGWGVRHITFVDNATVSYSNPVRQSLYNFAQVGKQKAPAAAESLKAIFPSVVSEGVVMNIPMPGHPVGESLLQETVKNITQLVDLIENHDVIFLLMDSRESRWLPTVIGASYQKLVMNAALGYDSYLVMRHGVKSDDPSISSSSSSSSSIPGDHLGCYFCSDVTAPGNSGQARTLDQQCTVTRPGVSAIAGSLAVELMVSVLQHDLQSLAPALVQKRDEQDCILGVVPHSIRGFLNKFETIMPAIQAFPSCVGCSHQVIQKFREEKVDFVLKVLESKKYLEDLTGLTELQSYSGVDDVLELECDPDSD